MKHFYIALITFLTFTNAAAAQVLIYHENFSGTGAIAGVYADPADSWGYTSAMPSTLAQSSKGNYVRTSAAAAAAKSLWVGISTLGYSAATITWEQFRNNFKNVNTPLTAPVELQYSTDRGVTRTTFYTSTTHINSSWNKVNNGSPIPLPAAALGMPEVRLYWKINFTNGNNEAAYYALDDITIVGTPETGVSTFSWASRPLGENPFAVSGIESTTPYTVDGVTMRWSSALSAGVAHEIAKVDDANFKAGTKTLTLVQTGASSTAGSIIQLDLNKPVEDLTFTIFDVDFTADQFTDRLSITGYNNGTPVPLVKNKVKTTSYNQLTTSAPVALSGLLSNDNASSEGDVTISFSQPVTKVVIRYNNYAAIRNANGRQGIAIHNLSWRKEQQISVLPVELISFNGIKQNGATRLNWTTASEKDNERFEIERSLDGSSFSKIGEIVGSGTSSKKLNYTFSDTKPATGANYYRLRQVDFDGKTSFSKTVVISFAAAKAGTPIAQVYPTVATSQVTIALVQTDNSNTAIQISDTAGKTIMQHSQLTDQNTIVPVQHLKAGVYFVTVSNGQVRETYRFLKQ